MHCRILGGKNGLTRVHDALKAAGSVGLTTWELAMQAKTVCPATCVSELNHRGVPVETCRTMINGQRGFVYRLREGWL